MHNGERPTNYQLSIVNYPFSIDLNCDLGEGVLRDGEPVEPLIMPWISSANIACGAHAGDAAMMAWCVRLARQHGVAVGAHPSYDDRAGFGRNTIPMPPAALRDLVQGQIAALQRIAHADGVPLAHVKPHGALYNDAAADRPIADAIVQALRAVDPALRLFGLPGSALQAAAAAGGVPFVAETFADRAFNPDGTLVSRKLPGAVISDPAAVVARCLALVQQRRVRAITGEWIAVHADTVCLHGDSPDAPRLAARLHHALTDARIRISAP